MKSLFLALLLFLVILFAKWPPVGDAVDRNLAAIEMVHDWKAEPRYLYQVTCVKNGNEITSSFPASSPPPTTNDHQTMLIAARDAFFEGDCEDALAYWKLVLQNDPQDRSAAIMQFLSSGLEERYFPVDTSPVEFSKLLFWLGQQAKKNQAQNQSQYWFAHSFALYPSRLAADQLLTYQSQPAQQALIWQRLADTLDQDDPDYWWAVGKYSELEKEWHQALQAYAEGGAISPKPYEFLIREGQILAQMEDWDRAETVFLLANDQRPSQITPYLELGHLYLAQGEFHNAKIWYGKALAKFPNNFSAIFFFGLVNYNLEEKSQAGQYFQRALELKPGHALSAYYLAQTLYRSGDSKKALEYLAQAVNLQTDKSWRWLVELGDWRERAGDVQGALSAYREALALQQDNIDLLNKIQKIESRQ
jgi:tetratricopeptide (TPR) repeat protein